MRKDAMKQLLHKSFARHLVLWFLIPHNKPTLWKYLADVRGTVTHPDRVLLPPLALLFIKHKWSEQAALFSLSKHRHVGALFIERGVGQKLQSKQSHKLHSHFQQIRIQIKQRLQLISARRVWEKYEVFNTFIINWYKSTSTIT